MADPVGDRLVESLRIAREVGGSDLGRLLRTLSELPARGRAHPCRAGDPSGLDRQRRSPGGRGALGGPGHDVHSSSESLRAYSSAAGVAVLAIGGAVCLVAYRLMVRIGRLPEEERVLR